MKGPTIAASALLFAAWIWPDVSGANPIAVNSSVTPPEPKSVSGTVTLVCAFALIAESVCVALLSGRRGAGSMMVWFAITLATFLVFIVGPTGDWAPVGPAGVRLIPSVVAELLVVLVEGAVLWRIWFRGQPGGAARAFAIALAGNLLSMGIGGLYMLAA